MYQAHSSNSLARERASSWIRRNSPQLSVGDLPFGWPWLLVLYFRAIVSPFFPLLSAIQLPKFTIWLPQCILPVRENICFVLFSLIYLHMHGQMLDRKISLCIVLVDRTCACIKNMASTNFAFLSSWVGVNSEGLPTLKGALIRPWAKKWIALVLWLLPT